MNRKANAKINTDIPQEIARKKLEEFFEKRNKEVFFARQIEVQNEDEFFHWVTHRVTQELIDRDLIRSETRKLSSGAPIKLLWNRSYRYYKRSAEKLIKIVEEYSDPNVGAYIGLHGEMMVLEGFARSRFVMIERNTQKYGDREWKKTGHNLDFIFEKDSIPYGIEVKNSLGYIDPDEFRIKIEMCKKLGIRPVFVVRMMPKTWIQELQLGGGFALIMKYQLYPWTHKKLARKVAKELDIPVDSPRVLKETTMKRFLNWHKKHVILESNSQKKNITH